MIAAQNAAIAAERQYQLGQQQLDWAKQQYAQDRATNQPIIDSFIAAQNNATNFAKQQQDFYTQTYQPLEAQYAAAARDWASPDRIQQQVGAAQADVAQQFEGARQAAAQQLKDYGVDPSSGRYAATDLITRTQQGAAQAAAGTNTANMVQMQGLGLQQNAINIGRGYPGAIATTMGTANNSGNSALGGVLQTTASGANTMGTGVQWSGLGNQAQGLAINGFNNAYNGYWNAVNGYNQANNYSSGIGSALGLIGGSMMRFMADGGPVRSDAAPSPFAAPGVAPGYGGGFGAPPYQSEQYGGPPSPGGESQFSGAPNAFRTPQQRSPWAAGPGAEAIRSAIPQQFGQGAGGGAFGGGRYSPFLADGGQVPSQASPTAGAATDDVPAQLTAGEYVLPKDVVEWIGEKGANDVIARARKERQQMTQQTGAIPSTGPASGRPPAFVSRPQQQAALPLR